MKFLHNIFCIHQVGTAKKKPHKIGQQNDIKFFTSMFVFLRFTFLLLYFRYLLPEFFNFIFFLNYLYWISCVRQCIYKRGKIPFHRTYFRCIMIYIMSMCSVLFGRKCSPPRYRFPFVHFIFAYFYHFFFFLGLYVWVCTSVPLSLTFSIPQFKAIVIPSLLVLNFGENA